MAETDTPVIVDEITHVRTGPWAVNYRSDAFDGGSLNVELKAAPTRPNSATYLTHVSMGVFPGTSHETFANCRLLLIDGVGDEVFGPVPFQENGQVTFSKDFTKPLKITDNKALDLTGVGYAYGYQPACWVFIEGYTGDKPIS